MEHFTNDTLSISSLPRHDAVPITPIHPNYWNVIVVNFIVTFLVMGVGLTAVAFMADKWRPLAEYMIAAYIIFMGLLFALQRITFRKRGYALRQRDLIYRRGVIATVTTIIPFSRIQHVALNEGLISRHYGLAQLQVFTAGGASSDMKISGLIKADAEKIKELIMTHISETESGNVEKGIQE